MSPSRPKGTGNGPCELELQHPDIQADAAQQSYQLAMDDRESCSAGKERVSG